MTVRSALLGLATAALAVFIDLAAIRVVLGPVPIADPGAGTALLLLSAVIGAAIVAVAAAPVGRDRAVAWLDDRGLPTQDDVVAQAAAWLRRTRTLRGIGFTLPFVSGVGPAWLINVSGLAINDPLRARLLDLHSSWPVDSWAAPIVGYAIGAVLAELTRPRFDDAAVRTADLRPRELAAYLPGFSRQGPRVLVGVAVVVAVVTAMAGLSAATGPSSLTVVLAAGLALTINEAVARGVVQRRQAASNAVAIALDDAARSTTVHAVAGSAIGVIGAMVGNHLSAVALDLGGGLGTGVSLVAFVVGIGSYGVWLGHGVGLAHRVRRDGAREVVA